MINVAEGDEVRQGQQVAVVEAMKMEHVIAAPHAGIVRGVTMHAGDVVREGFPIVFVKEPEVAGGAVGRGEELDLDHIRDDLRENIARHAMTLDEIVPRRSPAAARPATRCRAKTSSGWSIRARSTSTGRWWWRGSSAQHAG